MMDTPTMRRRLSGVFTTTRLRRAMIELAVIAACVSDAVLGNESHSPMIFAVAWLGTALLPLRHRYPELVLLASLPGAGTRIALLTAAFALLALCRSRGTVRDTLPFAVLVALALLVPWPPGPSAVLDATAGQLVQAVIYAVALTGAPVAAGLLSATKTELQARLAELSRTREREQQLRSAQAVTAERARIAREMHDVVAHEVSLIAVQAGALQVSSPDQETRRTAAQLRRLAVHTLTELRAMVGFLRTTGGDSDELAPQPTMADLKQLTHDAGFPVTLDLDSGLASSGEQQTILPAQLQRAVYRTVQEGLTNVRKHAGGAHTTVTIDRRGSALTVELLNDAPLTELTGGLPSGGHGLAGLRERAALLGGALTAKPTEEGGFRLKATFPVAPIHQMLAGKTSDNASKADNSADNRGGGKVSSRSGGKSQGGRGGEPGRPATGRPTPPAGDPVATGEDTPAGASAD